MHFYIKKQKTHIGEFVDKDYRKSITLDKSRWVSSMLHQGVTKVRLP